MANIISKILHSLHFLKSPTGRYHEFQYCHDSALGRYHGHDSALGLNHDHDTAQLVIIPELDFGGKFKWVAFLEHASITLKLLKVGLAQL